MNTIPASLATDNGIIGLGYDYSNDDFPSGEEAWNGLMLKLSDILSKYDGNIGDSLEHLAICTSKDISVTLRNKDTGESESVIYTSKQLCGLKGKFYINVPEAIRKYILESNLKQARAYTASREKFINAKKNKVELLDKLKPIMERYVSEYNSCKAEMSVPEPLRTVTVLRLTDNVVNWYDLLDRNVISRADVLKLIVANTEEGHNDVNHLLCDWAKGNLSRNFHFRLVSNKGIWEGATASVMAACGHFSRSDRSGWKVGGVTQHQRRNTTEYRFPIKIQTYPIFTEPHIR